MLVSADNVSPNSCNVGGGRGGGGVTGLVGTGEAALDPGRDEESRGPGDAPLSSRRPLRDGVLGTASRRCIRLEKKPESLFEARD